MNNNSYVIISADKLEAIFLNCCPPIEYDRDNGCFGAGEDCLDCWKSWLKDGE